MFVDDFFRSCCLRFEIFDFSRFEAREVVLRESLSSIARVGSGFWRFFQELDLLVDLVEDRKFS